MAANGQRGEAQIVVNGRAFTLRPTMNSLCVLEEKTGKSTADLMQQASEGHIGATRAVLWSYLQKHHASDFKSFEAVGDMIDEVGLDEVTEQLMKVMERNQPPADSHVAPKTTDIDRPPEA